MMKCISIDLDGTLLNSKHEISEENLQTLHDLKKQGHYVILNTGRALADVIKIQAVQQLELPIFCINGSMLYSKSGELLYEAIVPISTYKEIFSRLKDLDIGILVYTNYGGFPSTLPPLQEKSKEELTTLFQQYDYDQFLTKEDIKIYKIMALVYDGQLEKLEDVKKALGNTLDIFMAASLPNNLELTSSEANKGKAILRYQKLMNLHFEEIIAIGDGGNDLGQFEVATTSIAMGNAPAYIQNIADVVTKTNDENGFSYAMRHQLKLIPTSETANI
ncbi:HAD family hydrolase [Sutcliffiella cohnii]|uniref:HAD family hydrolase n=1 Tax=Sutcliffiella cohnii TaxID=33932 RepID=UPI002E1DFC24|nr:HAD family hydrolase [Sutcliffiella cohnii]